MVNEKSAPKHSFPVEIYCTVYAQWVTNFTTFTFYQDTCQLSLVLDWSSEKRVAPLSLTC